MKQLFLTSTRAGVAQTKDEIWVVFPVLSSFARTPNDNESPLSEINERDCIDCIEIAPISHAVKYVQERTIEELKQTKSLWSQVVKEGANKDLEATGLTCISVSISGFEEIDREEVKETLKEACK